MQLEFFTEAGALLARAASAGDSHEGIRAILQRAAEQVQALASGTTSRD